MRLPRPAKRARRPRVSRHDRRGHGSRHSLTQPRRRAPGMRRAGRAACAAAIDRVSFARRCRAGSMRSGAGIRRVRTAPRMTSIARRSTPRMRRASRRRNRRSPRAAGARRIVRALCSAADRSRFAHHRIRRPAAAPPARRHHAHRRRIVRGARIAPVTHVTHVTHIARIVHRSRRACHAAHPARAARGACALDRRAAHRRPPSSRCSLASR